MHQFEVLRDLLIDRAMTDPMNFASHRLDAVRFVRENLPVGNDCLYMLEHRKNNPYEYSVCFLFDGRNSSIMYEGLIPLRVVNQLRLADVYLSRAEVDDLCKKYGLVRVGVIDGYRETMKAALNNASDREFDEKASCEVGIMEFNAGQMDAYGYALEMLDKHLGQ